MSDVTEQDKSVNWYKCIVAFLGAVNFFAFLTGIFYLVIIQRFMFSELFLGWYFSINDTFFIGWILLLSEYQLVLFCFTCIPILYMFYFFYKKSNIKSDEKQRNDHAGIYFLLGVLFCLIMTFIFYYMSSVASYAKKDAQTIQWSAIACQTLPSKNCYCYTQSSEKTGEKIYSLTGAFVYQNSDHVWLVDEKGMLHVLANKNYELIRLSDDPFEFDN